MGLTMGTNIEFKETLFKLFKDKVHVGYLSIHCNGVEGAVVYLNPQEDAILGFYAFDDYEIVTERG